MDSETDVIIQQLRQVIELLQSQKKEELLTPSDLKTFSIADAYFGEKYRFTKSYSKFLKNLPITTVDEYIRDLEKKAEGQETKKRQEASIPPELETLVAEYQENQDLLNSEEAKKNELTRVRVQVEAAIARQKKIKLALENKDRHSKKYRDPDEAFAALGSPKSGSKTAALAASYNAVKQVAFTYSGFNKLSPQVQNQIISAAVDLNTVGIVDIDTAIQSSALLTDTTNLDPTDQANLATIPGGFVSSVYKEVTTSKNKVLEHESNIIANEDKIYALRRQGKINEAQALIEENQHISALIEGESISVSNRIAKKTELFEDYKKGRDTRLSKNPDIKDIIDEANKNVSSIQYNLKQNGVKPNQFNPFDDAHLLENAIRHDMPGELQQYAGYEAEQAAAFIRSPQTQNPELSFMAPIMYGKGLTLELLSKVRQFASANPESKLGRLFQNRKDIFDSASTQIRKLSESTLGKEIAASSVGKAFKSVSKFFGKISDKIGGFGTVMSFMSDPWGALRSWAGRKAGEFILRKLAEHLGSEVLKQGAETLLKNGLKEGIKKLAQQAAAKAAIKAGASAGVKVGLEVGAQAANVVPGLGLLIAVAIEIIFWIGDKIFGAVKRHNIETYGEDVKARDYVAVPAAVLGTVIGVVGSFFVSAKIVTAKAIGSATGTIILGGVIVFIFYVTSIAVAPLISTLVQLESTQSVSRPATGCANTSGIFVSQRDPAWKDVYCSNCVTSGSCKIGSSGCSSASMTMILNSFGVDANVVDIWNKQHEADGYVYWNENTPPNTYETVPPFESCGSDNDDSLKMLTNNGLAVTDIGQNMDEADRVIANCGLILAAGLMQCEAGYCGHLLVIIGHEGNQITTMDPWYGENYVHTLGDSYQVRRMWAVVP